jgi:predicted NAD/FAD-binding protein
MPGEDPQLCVHYLINRLQPLPFKQAVLVSLNPIREPRADCVLREINYSHPVFDAAAVAAQAKLASLQGVRNTWFCGAWTGYGFHEDGLKSGLEVAEHLMALAQNGQSARHGTLETRVA